MKPALPLLAGLQCTMAVLTAEDALQFPSPDGRFAIDPGAYESRHYDDKRGWVTDSAARPAAIVEVKSHKVVLQFDTPFRPDEDKALWNATATLLAWNHRGNKTTETKAYRLESASFREMSLPELPEVELDIAPPRNPNVEQEFHFNHDAILPLRWLDDGDLLISREKSLTDTTGQETTYTREYLITVSFDAKHEGSVKKVTPQKQTVHVAP